MKRVTITDIARASGYSKTAVSFAFNRPERISAEALGAIRAAAEMLGYFPDPVARNLSRSRSDTIGILLPQSVEHSFQNPYLVEILRGVGKACHDMKLTLSIIPPVKGRYQELAAEAAVDGLLALGLGPDAGVFNSAERRHLPFVAIDGGPFPEAPSVGIDDFAASKALAQRLWDLGHRNILLLGLSAPAPPESYHYSGIHRLRAEGVLEIFGADDVVRMDCEASRKGGMEAARRLLMKELAGSGKKGALTAVISFSDVAALGFIAALGAAGIQVPGDFSVAGFDGIPEALLVHPPLAGIRQPGFAKGAAAARLLFALMAGEQASPVTMDWELVDSGSMGPVQSS